MSWTSLQAAALLALQLPRCLKSRACASITDVSDDNARSPVVLVHGYCGTDAVWTPLRSALAEVGFGHVVRVRYNALTAHPPALADWLADVALAAAAGTPGVHLVGHSLGGVLLRAAVQRTPALAERVLGAVSISSPHRGVAVARLAPGPCARWMHPRDGVEGPPARADVRWLAFWSDGDHVVPRSSAQLDEPGAGNVLIPGCGHLGICHDPRLIRSLVRALVATELDLAATAAPADTGPVRPVPVAA